MTRDAMSSRPSSIKSWRTCFIKISHCARTFRRIITDPRSRQDRRKIEQEMFNGQLLGVIATTALATHLRAVA
jgi:hypothetical protein